MESQVSELNDLLSNIYSNYIPNKTVLCDGKDSPWKNNRKRTVIEMKNNGYKECIRSGMRHDHYVHLENLTTELSNSIRDTKQWKKQILNIYGPVSLLTIFKHLMVNKLLNPNQSGFIAGNSCIYLLISIAHEIYASFEARPSLEVRGAFLDISKAFDWVWHEGLTYKIKCIVVKGDLLALTESFLFERPQRVVLNGPESEWLTVKAGVTQGSIGSPFLVYTNNLSDNLESNVKLFADDTLMFSFIPEPINTLQKLNIDLDKISLWANKWKMSFNPDPSKQAQDVFFSWKINKVIIHFFYLIILPFIKIVP